MTSSPRCRRRGVMMMNVVAAEDRDDFASWSRSRVTAWIVVAVACVAVTAITTSVTSVAAATIAMIATSVTIASSATSARNDRNGLPTRTSVATSRRKISCRSPASSTCSTPTRSCVRPAICRDRTTCTSPWARSRSMGCARVMPCTVPSVPRVRATAATSVRSSCRCSPSTPSTA